MKKSIFSILALLCSIFSNAQYWGGATTPATGITGSDNSFFGNNSATSISSGNYNSAYGVNSAFTLTTGNYNSLFGNNSGYSISSGQYNSLFGYQSGYNISTGNYSSFFGYKSGYSVTSGLYNSLFGYNSGTAITTGSNNTFYGYNTGYTLQSGEKNTYVGSNAGASSSATDNTDNTLIGYNTGIALLAINPGVYYPTYNTFVGSEAGTSTTSGGANVFVGASAGFANTSGKQNAFLGTSSGSANTAGIGNTCFGYQSGHRNSTGSDNVFLGNYSGRGVTSSPNVSKNTFFGSNSGYLNEGDNSVLIGFNSGYNNTADGSVFMGYEAGYHNTAGAKNTYLGYRAGAYQNGSSSSSIYSERNTFIGYLAGEGNSAVPQASATKDNVAVGYGAGKVLDSGHDDNTLVGSQSGYLLQSARCSFIGKASGYNTWNGENNTFVGYRSGWNNQQGVSNVMIGTDAGLTLFGGSTLDEDDNVFIGSYSGNNYNGGNNVFIGTSATSTGTENVRIGDASIGNSSYSTALGANTSVTDDYSVALGYNSSVAGQFAVAIGENSTAPNDNTIVLGKTGSGGPTVLINQTTITGSGGTNIGGTPATFTRLEVNGDILTTGTVYYSSDKNLKKNIKTFSNGMDVVRKLKPVTYEFKDDVFFPKNDKDTSDVKLRYEFTKGNHIGFLAQDLKEVLPDAVREKADGYLAVNYNHLFGVFAQGLKEQDVEITNTKNEIQQLKDQNAELAASVEELKNMISLLSKNGSVNETNKGGITSVVENSPKAYLEQNSPNPFSENTVIKYFIPSASGKSRIVITSNDAIEVLSIDIAEKGFGNIIVSGNALRSGSYVLNLYVDGKVVDTKKMLLVK